MKPPHLITLSPSPVSYFYFYFISNRGISETKNLKGRHKVLLQQKVTKYVKNPTKSNP